MVQESEGKTLKNHLRYAGKCLDEGRGGTTMDWQHGKINMTQVKNKGNLKEEGHKRRK